jgi:uncharacterized membrane protein YccF (DUF307 family)
MSDAQDSPTERTDVPATPAVAQWNPPPSAPPPAGAPPPQPTWSAPPSTGPSLWIRAIWFIFIGWWLSGVAIAVAYVMCAIIIGIPIGFMIFNQLPLILTLRPRSLGYVADGTVEQLPLWLRAIWFIFIGWWLGFLYMAIAWFLCVIIITLPVGLWLFNRVGAVMTLLRY